MFSHVLCESTLIQVFCLLESIPSWLFLVCVYRGSYNKAWAVAVRLCSGVGIARLIQLILNIDTPLCAELVEAFLYPVETVLSLLITVSCEKRHSANRAGPSSGLLFGLLSTNYDDLLCRECCGATCCEGDVQPRGWGNSKGFESMNIGRPCALLMGSEKSTLEI